MSESYPAGVLDASVLIDITSLDPEKLPETSVTTAVTLAELAAGPVVATDAVVRARRIAHLHWAQTALDALPFDVDAAHYYGALCSLVVAAGRVPRRRIADLMIASIAAARGLPLFTRNPADFAGLGSMVTVVSV